jgi:drug/metabolite transporter (DMT)-like permease
MYLGKQLINKHNVPPTSLFWKNYLLQGLTNALNGICLVYSSPPSHTPPILFVILINLGIFFGMILTKYMIPSKRHINYRNKSVYISLICLALSVGITIAGDIVGKGDEATSFNGWSVMWILITTIASFFSALYNVLQERYMLESHLMIKPEEENTNLLKTLYWTSLFQLMFMILFFWVDMIPHFGYTSNFPDFFNNLKLEIQCFFFSH